MDTLFTISNKLLDKTPESFIRKSFANINWNAQLIEIRGSRGVGKTTLMRQKANELRKKNKQVLYITLDNPFFFNHSIIEVADYFEKYGGKYLFIDEVHKYPSKQKNYDWSAEIKYIYDHHSDLKLVYTGSSIIQLYKGKGDLSRRKSSYYLPGLSFREFLEFNNMLKLQALDLNNILQKYEAISREITSKIKILPLFKNYLIHGYFPFYNEDPSNYQQKLTEVLSLIIETDLPAAIDTGYDTTIKIKKLLAAISSSVPYTPNIIDLRKELFISDHRTLLKYLLYLEKADIIKSISKSGKGKTVLRKPDKIYLNNTNIAYALLNNPDIGNLRETFFLNQLNAKHKINSSVAGDFIIDNTYTFEIGGKNKTGKQIKGTDESYIVSDEIETGHANKIPLWLFGFLY